MVLTGACQFGHGVGGFMTNSIHSGGVWQDAPPCGAWQDPVLVRGGLASSIIMTREANNEFFALEDNLEDAQ